MNYSLFFWANYSLFIIKRAIIHLSLYAIQTLDYKCICIVVNSKTRSVPLNILSSECCGSHFFYRGNFSKELYFMVIFL